MRKLHKQCKGGTLHLVRVPTKYEKEVTRTARKTLIDVSGLLMYHKPIETVIFSSTQEFVIPESGIGAHAIIQGDIVVNIDFSRHDVKKILKKELPSTLYHEFSHIVRKTVHPSLYETLIESLVTEGIASYIEQKVFRKRVPYVERIRNEEKYWLKAQKSMGEKTYNHAEWFFGRGKLPRWIGYRLGYLLVDSFMKQRRNFSLAQLVRTKPSEVIQGYQLS